MTDDVAKSRIQVLEAQCLTLQTENGELLKTVQSLTAGLNRITQRVDQLAAAKTPVQPTQEPVKLAAVDIERALGDMSDGERSAVLLRASLALPRELRPGSRTGLR